jgi:hypothetical protein
MIIHSPIISGSLTFADGATVTYPDGGSYSGSFSGSIQVHNVQSDLIPDASGAYDLGSEAFPFQDLWLVGSTLNIGGIGIGAASAGLSFTKKSDGTPADIGAKSISIGGIGVSGNKKFKLNANNKVTLLDANDDVDTIEVKEIILKDISGNGKNTKLKNDGGTFTTSEVDDDDAETAANSEGSLSGSFTGSIQDAEFNGDATFNDNITVSGQFGSAVIPSASETYDLGSTTKKWNHLYALSASIDSAEASGSFTGSFSGSFSGGGLYAGWNAAGDEGTQQDISGGTTVYFRGDTTTNDITTTTTSLLGVKYVEFQINTGSDHFLNAVTDLATTGLGHILPAAHNTYDLGSTEKYWRDLYLSSGSLYINGIQVLSTDGTDLTFQTDAGESVKILETGNDTITLESVNGDITLTATGTGNIELDAPIQIAAGKNILSSDGNAIAFASDISLGSNDIFAANLSGVVSSSAITYTGDNISVAGNTIVVGNLTVQGTTTSVDSNTVNIGDNQIVLNSDETGTPTQNGGIAIERGTETNASLIWNETNDYWMSGLLGAESRIVVGVGNTEITTLGTITTGVWNGTAIAHDYIGLDAIDGTNIADNAIDSEHYADGSIDTDHIAADAVTGAKIADDAINSEHYADGSIDTAHLAADAVTSAKIADNAINSEHYVNGSIDTIHIGDGQITNGKLGADAVDGAKIADDSIDSEHYVDGSIDTAHLAADAVTGAKIADDAINSEHYVDGSIDTAHLAADAVTGAKIADDSIDSEHYIDGSIDAAHLASNSVTTVKIADDAVTSAKLAGSYTGTWAVTGAITATGDITAYAGSDERLKDNIEVISNPIEKVQALKGVTWDWNDNASDVQHSLPNVGVIAQDVEKVLPQLVRENEGGYKAVDYSKLVGLLIEAVKDQQSQIDELKSKLG